MKNVLLICTDHWGQAYMGGNGKSGVMTPTLDYLKKGGISFSNFYTTCPVCIPARRSLMTGLSPRSHGDRVYRDRLPMPDAPTMAQTFRENGYQTMAVGKLHVYPQRSRIGFDDVILVEEGRYEFGVTDDYEIWLGERGHVGEEFLHGMGNNTYYTRPWHLEDDMHPTEWITRQMMKQIARRDPTRPFFFYCSYPFPHPPLVPLNAFWDMYADMRDPEGERDTWSKEAPVFQDLCSHGRLYGRLERDRARRAFYAQCTHIDYSIRLLLGTLREQGILEDTIIGFTSDHGEMLFQHEMVGKRCFYEPSARVPFLLWGEDERLKGGREIETLACLEDIMPTLLDLCQIPIPNQVEGISLVKETARPYLYGEVGEDRRATRMIRWKSYKLIYYPWGNLFQLFDLEKDPGEHINCEEMEEYRAISDQMKTYLRENLYGKDTGWIEKEVWKGEDFGDYGFRFDPSLNNQRGLHWPQP